MKAIVRNATPVTMDLTHSSVEIAVKETIGSFVADLPISEILVTATPGTSQIDSAVFRSSLAGIKTGNTDRDREMNEWQQTDKFPDVIFTLTAIEPTRNGTSIARGQLQLNGAEPRANFAEMNRHQHLTKLIMPKRHNQIPLSGPGTVCEQTCFTQNPVQKLNPRLVMPTQFRHNHSSAARRSRPHQKYGPSTLNRTGDSFDHCVLFFRHLRFLSRYNWGSCGYGRPKSR